MKALVIWVIKVTITLKHGACLLKPVYDASLKYNAKIRLIIFFGLLHSQYFHTFNL